MSHISKLIIVLGIFFVACGQSNQPPEAGTQKTNKPAAAVLPNVQPVSVAKSDPVQLQDEISNSRRNAITMAVEKLKPAVVGINVTQIREYTPRTFQDEYFQYFFPEYRLKQRVKNLGSGFVISPDGYIVTNEHVVHGAIEIVVSLVAGKEYRAKLIGADYKTDVALLKIDGENLPYCEFGNSDDIIIGEWAIALGNPFGLFEIGQQPSVTVGVISSKNLDFGIQEDERLYQEMIQTDASINPGNSGGPMANALGKVIGMNTFIFTGGGASNGSIGLGFAIPINRIREIVGQLLQYGKVDRQFWTGLEVETMQPRVARYFGLTNTNGVIVTNIEANSPAAQAGLKIYDIIIEMNSVKVTSTQDIWKIIDNLDAKAGDVIPLKYIRKGRVYETKLKLGKVT